MSRRSAGAAALRWGAWYGIIIGVLGVVQIAPSIVAVAASAPRLSAYRSACHPNGIFPPCAVPYAGVVDTIWALFFGTGCLAFAVTLMLYFRAGRAATRDSKLIGDGIRAALLAAALGLALATIADVLVASAGLHPLLAADFGTGGASDALLVLSLNALALPPTLLVAAVLGWMGAVSAWRPQVAMRERRPPGVPAPEPYSVLPGAPQPPYPYPYIAATEDEAEAGAQPHNGAAPAE